MGGLLNQLNSGSAAAAQVGWRVAWARLVRSYFPLLAALRCRSARVHPINLLPTTNNRVLSTLQPSQGEEPWRATDMAAAVDTFRVCFLDALQQARPKLQCWWGALCSPASWG